MTQSDHQPPSMSRSHALPFLALAALLVGSAAISACSTTEGFGEDVKHLGGNIEDSAAKNK